MTSDVDPKTHSKFTISWHSIWKCSKTFIMKNIPQFPGFPRKTDKLVNKDPKLLNLKIIRHFFLFHPNFFSIYRLCNRLRQTTLKFIWWLIDDLFTDVSYHIVSLMLRQCCHMLIYEKENCCKKLNFEEGFVEDYRC